MPVSLENSSTYGELERGVGVQFLEVFNQSANTYSSALNDAVAQPGNKLTALAKQKTTKDKGTVIAENNSESEAFRVAGRMLRLGKIDASELQQKVNELKAYKPAQIKDFEKSIFAEQKGLDTVSDGLSQAIQINETIS